MASSLVPGASNVGASTSAAPSPAPAAPASTSAAPRLTASTSLPSSPIVSNGATPDGSRSTSPASQQIRLGVCAMDRKSRSKPILSRLLATGNFDCFVFGDKVILDEDIEHWPTCDFLITFFSSGFPMDKAIAYIKLRKPVCINDLPRQKVFWDRRVVLSVLDKIGVRTPKRLIADRDGGPHLDPSVAAELEREFGIKLEPRKDCTFAMHGDDAITINGKSLTKPFVEKPVSGEDHNVNIYFKAKGMGGGRRLFRKVGNKSSEHDPTLVHPRTDGSYVYEEFIDVENAEDIKVYTLGPNFVHAETRKSPVVDGVVRRNNEGKEIRFICQLTDEERKMASDISKAFKQNICGFDLLRANGKSYVIDVNGWSFVKGNDFYYDKCAEILEKFCTSQLPPLAPAVTGIPSPKESKSWRLKSTTSVFRHADRTPKMKLKFNFKGSMAWCAPFVKLLQGRMDEITLRQPEHLQYIAEAAKEALEMPECDTEKVEQLLKIIDNKVAFLGTKAQIKPTFNPETGACEKVHIVVKWGGEFTHAARYQSRDIGENMRKDIMIMNKSLLDHTTIYTSSERRVVATAEVFSSALLDARRSPEGVEPIPHQLIVRKDLLDDSNAAKGPMDAVKKRLKTILRPGAYNRPDFCWPVPDVEPQEVVKRTIELMRYHRDTLTHNWQAMDVENIQARWCCGEYPYLFRERWEKLFGDFCDVELEKFDPARVSELYDSLKYDALHNRTFLETIFGPPKPSSTTPSSGASSTRSSRLHKTEKQSTLAAATELAEQAAATTDAPVDGPPKRLKELYKCAKELFDLKYGIERREKREIGLLTSWPLLHQIEQYLRASMEVDAPGRASFFFTKESHIQTLVNLILFSEIAIVMPRIPELDYMAYMTFEVYEREKGDVKEFSVRISLSEGAHAMPLDTSLDAKHALQVQPRRVLTNHVPLDDVLRAIARYTSESQILAKSTTPFEGLVEGEVVFGGRDEASNVGVHRFIPKPIGSGGERSERVTARQVDGSGPRARHLDDCVSAQRRAHRCVSRLFSASQCGARIITWLRPEAKPFALWTAPRHGKMDKYRRERLSFGPPTGGLPTFLFYSGDLFHGSNLPDELSTILKTNPVLLHVKFGPDGAFFVKTPDGVTCLRMSPRDPLALTVHSDQPPSKAYGRQAANKLGVPLNKIDVFAYSQRGYVAGTNVEGGQRFAWSDIPESLSRTLDAYLPDPHKGNIYDITISYAGDWMILFEGGSVKYSLRNNEHAKLALSELKPPFQNVSLSLDPLYASDAYLLQTDSNVCTRLSIFANPVHEQFSKRRQVHAACAEMTQQAAGPVDPTVRYASGTAGPRSTSASGRRPSGQPSARSGIVPHIAPTGAATTAESTLPPYSGNDSTGNVAGLDELIAKIKLTVDSPEKVAKLSAVLALVS